MTLAADFVRFPPPVEALDRALSFPGTALLRVATNGQDSGIMPAGDYTGIAMLVQLDSDCPRCVLWDGGRTRGLDIAFHTNPVLNGNPAILLSVSNDTNVYAARYEIDPRSPVGQKVFHSLEVEYLKDVGWQLWYDGELLTATASAGVHNDIGVGNTSHIAIGGVRNLSVTRARAAQNLPAIVGTQSVWSSLSSAGDLLKGAVGYVMVERSPGLPAFEARFQDEIFDEVDPGLSTSPNSSPNGFLWGDQAAPVPPIGYIWTRFVLSGRTTEGDPLPAEVPLGLSVNASPYVYGLQLVNDSFTPITLSDITVSTGGTGISFADFADGVGTPLLLTDTIPPGGSVLARLNVTRSSAVTDRLGDVTFDLGTGGTVEANFRVTVAATSQPDPRRPLFITGLRRFDKQAEMTSLMSAPLTGI
jgi:hypothetical protein